MRFSLNLVINCALSLVLVLAFLDSLGAGSFDLTIREEKDLSKLIERHADQLCLNQVSLSQIGRVWLNSTGTRREDGFSKGKRSCIFVDKKHRLQGKIRPGWHTKGDSQFESPGASFSLSVVSIWHEAYSPNALFDSTKLIDQNTQPDTTGQKSSREHPSRFVGYTMLGSGLFLSSWGIVSWEMKEYQECPPRNTDNVIKIVAGILLINAALFYLFGGCDQGSF